MQKTLLRRLLSGAVLLTLAPIPALAESSAIPALLRQAKYWEARGRRDLATQAYRRVLTLDSGNAAARRGLSGSPPAVARKSEAKAVASTAAPAKDTKREARAAAAPAPAQSDPGGKARANGFAALENGELERAETLFRSALRRAPGDSDALGGLGLVELRRERFAAARGLLQRASANGQRARWAEALASARFFADLRAAEADLDAGRVAEAQATAERLARSDAPQAREAAALLARTYEKQGRFADAAGLYTQAARTSSGAGVDRLRLSAIRAQAQAAAAAGRPAETQQLYERALSLQPDDAWLRYDFARFLRDQRRPMDASTVIAPLARSAAPEALYAAALFAEQSGQPATAEALMTRIPMASRTEEMRGFQLGLRAEAAIARGRTLATQGQQALALQSLRQIAEMPGLPAPQLASLAGAMFDFGDTASAATLAARAAEMPVERADDYDPIIRTLAATGQDMAADSALARATQAGANPAKLASMRVALAVARADRLRLAGQHAPAFDLLQQAWGAAPGDREVLAALARLYRSGGMNTRAAQTFRMILAAKPDDQDALLGFAETASAAGEHQAARDAAKRAIQLWPGDYRPYLAAARIEQARGNGGAARSYLRDARARYLAHQGGDATNPFAAGAQPFAAANPFVAAAPNNPFALDAPTAPMQLALAGTPPLGVAGSAFAAPTRSDGYATPEQLPGASTPSWGGNPFQPGPAAPQTGYADPILQGIEDDMRRLTDDRAPRADVTTGYRSRSGEDGLSSLQELSGTARISTGLGGGRIGAQAQAVVLDGGRASRSGLARIGRNATEEAAAIVGARPARLIAADSQTEAGVALSATYDSKEVQADIGTTPLGFTKHQVAGGLYVSPRFSDKASGRFWAERRPVTDSVLSYAGAVDPVSGQFWGAVMRSGGGASLSWDDKGTGAYVDGSWFKYDGTDVRSNRSLQLNAGAYARAYGDDRSTLTLGINANYQGYDNNQNYFTYGHGGYFSPQRFFSISFPARFRQKADGLEIDANIAPGYQTFSQDAEPLYPTDPTTQGLLDALKAQNTDVRARYDSLTETGFGLAAGASAWYALHGNTRVGGDVNVNTFGQYNEVRTSVGIKQVLGGDR